MQHATDQRCLKHLATKAMLPGRSEAAYQFMTRIRMPGGVCQPQRWLELDDIALAQLVLHRNDDLATHQVRRWRR